MKIGIMVDSLKMPLRDGIARAAELGAEGLQLYAVDGEMAPENLSKSARRELKRYIESHGLEVAALCGDLGGHGFTIAEDNPGKIERSKRIADVALDLGTDVITTHLGVVPGDETVPGFSALTEACVELGTFADSMDVTFAVETGPETSALLGSFIRSLPCSGITVNYDPANLVMVIGEDAAEGVAGLGDLIVHTHAKDGIMVSQGDPAVIYDHFAEGGIGDLRLGDYFKEVPLGEGDVDFPRYLSALENTGYDGYLTIEREVGDSPEDDISLAVRFLRELLSN